MQPQVGVKTESDEQLTAPELKNVKKTSQIKFYTEQKKRTKYGEDIGHWTLDSSECSRRWGLRRKTHTPELKNVKKVTNVEYFTQRKN